LFLLSLNDKAWFMASGFGLQLLAVIAGGIFFFFFN
jgi:hypothetical protein